MTLKRIAAFTAAGALAAAQDAQRGRAVKAGELTHARADRIKARRKAHGTALGGPGRHLLGHRGPGGRRVRWARSPPHRAPPTPLPERKG